MENEYIGMLKTFGGFVFANWEIFLGLAALMLLMKFIKMGAGVIRTLAIVYVLFVVYKYQDYDKIKAQLVSDVGVISEKTAPLKSYIDDNLTSKLKEEDKSAVDKLINETKTIVGGAFGSTEELINIQREKMNNGK